MKTSPKKEPQKAFCYTHYLNPALELHPEFVRFDYNSGSRDFTYTTHRHTDHELIYVENGIYKARVNGHRISLPPGQCLLLIPGDLHFDEAKRDLKYYSISFDIKEVPAHDETICLLRGYTNINDRVISKDCDFVFELIHEAALTMASHKPGSAQLAHILLHELFWRLVQIIPPTNYSHAFGRLSGGNEFVKRFYRVLDENIASPLELTELSRKMAMSPSQLNKLCNRVLESSPASLVQRYKMTRACELLTGSDLSIREIGEMLGFRDQFSFSRAFKRQESISPRQYRQQAERDFLEE